MRLILSGLLFLTASQGFAAEFLVKYKNTKALASIQQLATQKSAGLELRDIHDAGSFAVVDLREDAKVVTLARLISNPSIEWVTPNAAVHAFENIPGDKALRSQWAIEKIRATQAWQRAGNMGSKNTVIAVIDTGVDMNHQNLSRNVVPGYDFFGNDESPMDEPGRRNPGHGTHCGGIIAADGLVDGGTTGMAPNISLMPIRFLGPNGQGDLANGIKSIDYAIAHGAHVISASWGATIPANQATALIEAVKRASDAGVIFVVAAANDGKSNDSVSVYPANAQFENTIAVAASGSSDAKPSWSNYGRRMVHLASPGDGIMSTLPGNKYGNLSGTSMATPLVAGLVGFLKSQDPSLTGAQIRALLQTTGAKVNIETACNCRIDAFAAVDALLSRKMWMVPAAATLSGAGARQALAVMNGQTPFTFVSSNPAILSVDGNGVVSGVANGLATITVTDATGATVSSSNFNVVGMNAPPPSPAPNPAPTPAPPPQQPPNDPKQCPFDPQTCVQMCEIMPESPWCSAN